LMVGDCTFGLCDSPEGESAGANRCCKLTVPPR
jgi:hypothetical protein